MQAAENWYTMTATVQRADAVPGSRSLAPTAQRDGCMIATRHAWLLFGGQVAMLLIIGVSMVSFSQTGKTYCTADLGTCITSNRSSPWHVVNTPCPDGQSLQFVSVGVMGVRCHSIRLRGVSTPLDVCSAACAKQTSPVE
jgi:hypothetical protein